MIVIGDMIEEEREGGGGKWKWRMKFGIIEEEWKIEGVRKEMIEKILEMDMEFEIVRKWEDKIEMIVLEEKMKRKNERIYGKEEGLLKRGKKRYWNKGIIVMIMKGCKGNNVKIVLSEIVDIIKEKKKENLEVWRIVVDKRC